MTSPLTDQVKAELLGMLARKAELQVAIDKLYAVLEGIALAEKALAEIASNAAPPAEAA
jgi:hypothetical protein